MYDTSNIKIGRFSDSLLLMRLDCTYYCMYRQKALRYFRINRNKKPGTGNKAWRGTGKMGDVVLNKVHALIVSNVRVGTLMNEVISAGTLSYLRYLPYSTLTLVLSNYDE